MGDRWRHLIQPRSLSLQIKEKYGDSVDVLVFLCSVHMFERTKSEYRHFLANHDRQSLPFKSKSDTAKQTTEPHFLTPEANQKRKASKSKKSKEKRKKNKRLKPYWGATSIRLLPPRNMQALPVSTVNLICSGWITPRRRMRITIALQRGSGWLVW
jgi:hypothetical protein